MVETATRIQSVVDEAGRKTFLAGRYTPAEIVEHLKSALASDYTGRDINKLGMTKGEAAFLSVAESAQDGDISALEALLNRLLGKPVQQVNALNVSASLSEFLGGLAAEMDKADPFIDVDVDPLSD
jgi:hypothetical protein